MTSLLTPTEILAARQWAKRTVGYIPPPWQDTQYLQQGYNSMVRFYTLTKEGQKLRAALAEAKAKESSQ